MAKKRETARELRCVLGTFLRWKRRAGNYPESPGILRPAQEEQDEGHDDQNDQKNTQRGRNEDGKGDCLQRRRELEQLIVWQALVEIPT
jgi:hypothetical protein